MNKKPIATYPIWMEMSVKAGNQKASLVSNHPIFYRVYHGISCAASPSVIPKCTAWFLSPRKWMFCYPSGAQKRGPHSIPATNLENPECSHVFFLGFSIFCSLILIARSLDSGWTMWPAASWMTPEIQKSPTGIDHDDPLSRKVIRDIHLENSWSTVHITINSEKSSWKSHVKSPC